MLGLFWKNSEDASVQANKAYDAVKVLNPCLLSVEDGGE